MGQFLKMASSMLTKKLFSSLNQFVSFSHTNSNNSNFIKNGHFSAKRNSLTSKRNLQSIARFRGAKEQRDGSVFDPIAVGARNISTDPCLSNVTLGELRDAKFQSQKLQEKILRWIWEGESWSVFDLEKHPEKRVRASYKKYEEYHMKFLKEENPSLRQSQLRQLLKKEWVKSPENPLNQQHAAYN